MVMGSMSRMNQSNEPDTPTSPVIPGGLLTTAMAILPHREVDRARTLALSLDIPFWPQLPHAGYYEDMYVQASEHFPGMVLDPELNSLHFDTALFQSRSTCWGITTIRPISYLPPIFREFTKNSWPWIFPATRRSAVNWRDRSASG